ncbi:MAG: hypothetical protein VCB77_07485 [Alphaproteobacteria bacterium]
MSKTFEVLDRTVEYDGFLRLERQRLRFTLFEGGWSAPIQREVVIAHGHASAVVLYDPAADRVVLIEQCRAAKPTRLMRIKKFLPARCT